MMQGEIDVMEAGRAMDALVAETIFMKKPCKYTVTGIISTLTIWQCEHQSAENCYPDDKGACLESYSTEIAAAWKIAELMKDRKNVSDSFGFSWPCELSYLDDRQVWACVFHGQKSTVEGLGETAPLAICRAALKASLV
jgi:hypothetical protein